MSTDDRPCPLPEAEHPDGWFCILPSGHAGDHEARTVDERVVARWPREHPPGRGACDPEEPACCDGCAAAWAEPDPEEEA